MVIKVWAVSAIGILLLTISNIFLSLRIIQKTEEPLACGGVGNAKAWTKALVDANLTEYLNFLKKANIVANEAQLSDLQNQHKQNERCGHNDTITRNSSMIPMPPAFHIDEYLARWDDRRMYGTHDHVYTGPSYRRLSANAVVSLATQTSVDRLYWLVQSARHWSEPISIAVFTPDIEYGIAKIYFQYLTTCFPFLGEKITVHFTYPKEYPPKTLNFEIHDLLDLCDQPITVLWKLLGRRSNNMMKWRDKLVYPQNLLRNVARKNSFTEWVFLVDVDIVSVPSMSETLNDFLRSKAASECQKCAFVIPTYEVDEKVPLPSNKSSLLKLQKEKKAQPFHKKVFIFNQYATNFSLWESTNPDPDSDAIISHKVTNFEFFYEPFYVARDTVPPHDERFIGYGFTRNTQVYEMFVANYTFHVLNPIFTVHWGLQVKKARPKWRERQNNQNRKFFDGFKKEVYSRYQRDPLGMMKPKPKKKKKSVVKI